MSRLASNASEINDPRERNRCRGFTLVELLIVIGIIALLIAILLPVLNKARAAANNIGCQSNLRQIAWAIFQYANDNRGCYPILYCNSGLIQSAGTNAHASWSDCFLAPYLGTPINQNLVGQPWYGNGYQESPVFRCPADPRGLPIDMIDSLGSEYPGWGNSSYSLLWQYTSPMCQGGYPGCWWPESAQLIARSGGYVQLHAIVGLNDNTAPPAVAYATAPYDPVCGYDASYGISSPNTTFPYEIYPRGDNPLVLEGSCFAAFLNSFTQIRHGMKMNYISVDLSVLQADFTSTYYKTHFTLGYDPTQGQPGYPGTGVSPPPSDGLFFWYKCIGNQVAPWTKGTPSQGTTTTANGRNLPAGGAYIIDWPYYSITLSSGNLFRCSAPVNIEL